MSTSHFMEETNRNGEYLADFIQEKGLISANTKFQKNKSRQVDIHVPTGVKIPVGLHTSQEEMVEQ